MLQTQPNEGIAETTGPTKVREHQIFEAQDHLRTRQLITHAGPVGTYISLRIALRP